MRGSLCIEVMEAESRHCETMMTRTPSGAAMRVVERQPSSVAITLSMFSRRRPSSFAWSLGSHVKTLTRVAAVGSRAIVFICIFLGGPERLRIVKTNRKMQTNRWITKSFKSRWVGWRRRGDQDSGSEDDGVGLTRGVVMVADEADSLWE